MSDTSWCLIRLLKDFPVLNLLYSKRFVLGFDPIIYDWGFRIFGITFLLGFISIESCEFVIALFRTSRIITYPIDFKRIWGDICRNLFGKSSIGNCLGFCLRSCNVCTYEEDTTFFSLANLNMNRFLTNIYNIHYVFRRIQHHHTDSSTLSSE